MRVANLLQVGCPDARGLRFVADVLTVGNAVVVVGSRDDVLSVDLLRPPAQGAHAVLDGSDRYFAGLPVIDQCLDVFRLQGMGAHAPVSQIMQLIRDQRQDPFPIRLGGVAAVPIAVAELFQLVVQVLQGATLVVSVSDHLKAVAI